MSQKTRAALQADIINNFPDNTVGAISESTIRIALRDIVDSANVPLSDPGQGVTADSIKTSLESLTGTDRLDASAIKNLPSGGTPAWVDITGKPSTFAPATHTHAIADTTGLQAALTAKADASALTSGLAAKQDALVSGTNIKTINGTPVLGSGNIVISGGGGGSGDLLAANNLSDVANAATARANLGLGTAATQASTAFADASATTTALNLKAPLASPTFTGTPTVPTAAPGTNTTQAASTAFVAAAVAGVSGGGGGEDLGFGFDGAGSTLTAGLAGDRQINATRTITGWSLLGGSSGSLSVAIKKATITAGSVGSFSTIYTATLSSAQFASGDGTGFTSTALTATDVLRAEVVSASGISKATLIVKA